HRPRFSWWVKEKHRSLAARHGTLSEPTRASSKLTGGRWLKGLSEVQILHFLVQVGALLLASRVLADLMKRWGQAAVIGELLAGVVLGPSILGHLAPPVYGWLFPNDPVVSHLLEPLAWIGVIALLLYIGLETDLGILRGMGRTAAVVSVFGMVIPFACGLGLGWLLPAHYLSAPDQRGIFALFMAVAGALSPVPAVPT